MPKLKPFRVSYYVVNEVVDGRAPVRTALVSAADAESAKKMVATETRVTLNAYPFYRKFKEPKRKTWIVISGPESPATKEVLKDLAGMAAHDAHEQIMDTFKPKEVPAEKVKDWEAMSPYHVGEMVPPFGQVRSMGTSALGSSQSFTTSTSSTISASAAFVIPKRERRIGVHISKGHEFVDKGGYDFTTCELCGMSSVYTTAFNLSCPKSRTFVTSTPVPAPIPTVDNHVCSDEFCSDAGCDNDLGHKPKPTNGRWSQHSVCELCGMSDTYYKGFNIPCPLRRQTYEQAASHPAGYSVVDDQPMVVTDDNQGFQWDVCIFWIVILAALGAFWYYFGPRLWHGIAQLYHYFAR